MKSTGKFNWKFTVSYFISQAHSQAGSNRLPAYVNGRGNHLNRMYEFIIRISTRISTGNCWMCSDELKYIKLRKQKSVKERRQVTWKDHVTETTDRNVPTIRSQLYVSFPVNELCTNQSWWLN